MTRRYHIARRDGLWRVSKLSVPLTGGETPPLILGRCRDPEIAFRLWLACMKLEDTR